MQESEALTAIVDAFTLDGNGEDGLLWLQKKYSNAELIEIYDHHQGLTDFQRYISQAIYLQQKLEARNG